MIRNRAHFICHFMQHARGDKLIPCDPCDEWCWNLQLSWQLNCQRQHLHGSEYDACQHRHPRSARCCRDRGPYRCGSYEEPGIRRKKAGTGFSYVTSQGTKVQDQKTLKRIRPLAIPPAWTDVWRSAKPDEHLQATGRDARGRKQYRYHAAFREVRESTKYEHMVEFAHRWPAIRRTLAEHMTLRGLPREKVLATVVHLLETTLIRVGNDSYAKDNKSYGLTTLQTNHVEVNGTELKFHFKGKSGKTWQLRVKNCRAAKIGAGLPGTTGTGTVSVHR